MLSRCMDEAKIELEEQKKIYNFLYVIILSSIVKQV